MLEAGRSWLHWACCQQFAGIWLLNRSVYWCLSRRGGEESKTYPISWDMEGLKGVPTRRRQRLRNRRVCRRRHRRHCTQSSWMDASNRMDQSPRPRLDRADNLPLLAGVLRVPPYIFLEKEAWSSYWAHQEPEYWIQHRQGHWRPCPPAQHLQSRLWQDPWVCEHYLNDPPPTADEDNKSRKRTSEIDE